MKKYEYTTFSYPFEPSEHDLNKKGDLGWELVTIVREKNRSKDIWYTAYFKMEKQNGK